jgi:hypothetical protein
MLYVSDTILILWPNSSVTPNGLLHTNWFIVLPHIKGYDFAPTIASASVFDGIVHVSLLSVDVIPSVPLSVFNSAVACAHIPVLVIQPFNDQSFLCSWILYNFIHRDSNDSAGIVPLNPTLNNASSNVNLMRYHYEHISNYIYYLSRVVYCIVFEKSASNWIVHINW